MNDALATFPVALFSTFAVIALAEIGDKSQLVCMTLAARYRPWPVLLGALVAFATLNSIAVIFGAAAAHWLPEQLVLAVVGVLFLLFGAHALSNAGNPEKSEELALGSRSLFASTLLMITLAEFGDKTQIAVAGLGSTADPYAVWLGATLALAMTSALGVWAGRAITRYVSVGRLHKISGTVFIALGLLVLFRLLGLYF